MEKNSGDTSPTSEDSERSSSVCTIHDLPDSTLLNIFWFLDAKSLVLRVALVNKHWYRLYADEILWRQKLEEYMNHRRAVSSQSYPPLYFKDRLNDPPSSKDVYLKCLRGASEMVHWSLLDYVNHYMGSLLRRRVPYCCMSGPGLGKMAKTLITHVDNQTDKIFSNVGYFPSPPEVSGIGSGMMLKLRCGRMDTRLNLSILYPARRETRIILEANAENQNESGLRQAQQRMENNLLFQKTTSGSFELQPSVKKLLSALNGFVFNVSSELSSIRFKDDALEVLRYICHELHCFISDLPEDRPLLVLACRKSHDMLHVRTVDIVQCLQLENLNRPWLIHECVTEGMLHDLPPAFQWLSQQSKY